jgi:hypothetical protein
MEGGRDRAGGGPGKKGNGCSISCKRCPGVGRGRGGARGGLAHARGSVKQNVEEERRAGEKDKVTRRMGRWRSSTAACGGNQCARELAAGGGEGGRTAVAAEQRTERRQRRKRKGIFLGTCLQN